VIQRQLGHADLAITSRHLGGIDNAEIIQAVHDRPEPMIPPDDASHRGAGAIRVAAARAATRPLRREAQERSAPVRRWKGSCRALLARCSSRFRSAPDSRRSRYGRRRPCDPTIRDFHNSQSSDRRHLKPAR
jgi:hypothetical protein